MLERLSPIASRAAEPLSAGLYLREPARFGRLLHAERDGYDVRRFAGRPIGWAGKFSAISKCEMTEGVLRGCENVREGKRQMLAFVRMAISAFLGRLRGPRVSWNTGS